MTLLLQYSMTPIYGIATQRGHVARRNQHLRKTIMAQIAKTEAEKVTNNIAELGKRTANGAADATQEVANRTENTARRGFQTAQKTAGAALEVERAVARRSAEG